MAANSNKNKNKNNNNLEIIEEEKFNEPTVLEKHNKSSEEAKMMNDLQLKLNDLIKLSNEADKIKL
jgi:hypothetical protein